jgi:DNA-directed RNA polymerase subunit H (RpoH/RPB5)
MMANHNDEEFVERNKDFFVREITIKKSVSLDRLVEILRRVKTTGDLCVYLNEGGIRRIELHKRFLVDEEESDQILEILEIGDKTS